MPTFPLRIPSENTMTMNPNLHSWRFPSRVAALGFSLRLPLDWQAEWLPDEDPDFADPNYLMPLATVRARNAAVRLEIGARPAFEDGAVSDWAWQLLEEEGLPRPALHEHRLGDLGALVGESVGYTASGLMHLRFAFAEDGQRLVRVVLRAPYVLADAVDPIWFTALDSFRLESPFGPTVTLWSPAETSAPSWAPESAAMPL